jgi:hypothetical protein
MSDTARRHEVLLRAIDLVIAQKRASRGPDVERELDVLRSLRAQAVRDYEAERKGRSARR